LDDIINERPNISVITKIEALSWIHIDKNKESILRSFIEDSIIYELNSEVVNQCIKIKRNRKIKMPDAIIASTAICYQFILISSDKGFKGIYGLRLLDPFTI